MESDITAISRFFGAGIGAGQNGSDYGSYGIETIIDGGTVYARGRDGAGIGGGKHKDREFQDLRREQTEGTLEILNEADVTAISSGRYIGLNKKEHAYFRDAITSKLVDGSDRTMLSHTLHPDINLEADAKIRVYNSDNEAVKELDLPEGFMSYAYTTPFSNDNPYHEVLVDDIYERAITQIEDANYGIKYRVKDRHPSLDTYSLVREYKGLSEFHIDDNTYVSVNYLVKYNGNGNTEGVAPVDTNSYKNTEDANVMNQGSLKKEGYRFVGWTVNSNGTGTIYNTGDQVKITDSDIELFAKWEEVITFDVKYTDGVDNETIFEDQVYTIEKDLKTPEFSGTPTRSGYKFLGWTPEVSEFVTEDVTYTAEWERISHKVVYTDGVDNEELFADQETFVFEGLETPEFNGTPKRSGYKFIGWTPEVSEFVTEDVIYTAEWERISHKVVYTDGVEDEQLFADQETFVFEGLVTPEFNGTPTRAGYNFIGWTPEVSEFVTDDITYTAEWERISHKVVYTDGVEDEQLFADQETFVFEGLETPEFNGTPTRAGYKFIGWTPEISEFVTDDITYTAEWERISHKVVYTDGVEDEQLFAAQETFVFEGLVTPEFNGTPTRSGYKFIGWTPEVSEFVTEDITYTAEWEKESVEIPWSPLTPSTPKDEVVKPSLPVKPSKPNTPVTGVHNNEMLFTIVLIGGIVLIAYAGYSKNLEIIVSSYKNE